MAKNKAPSKTVANRAAYSRMSFLYQAAALLAQAEDTLGSGGRGTPEQEDGHLQNEPVEDVTTTSKNLKRNIPSSQPMQVMSRRLLTHMRSVSLKTKLRLRPAVKHTVCKFCDTMLIEGETCRSTVENTSRGGRKPWADVLAIQCMTCNRVRRYPVSTPRQPRRTVRGKTTEEDRPKK